MRQGDARTYLASLSPEGREFRNLQGKSEAEMIESAMREMEKVTAFKLLEMETVSDSEVVLTIYASGVNQAGRFKLQRFGNEWKFDGPMKDGVPPATK
jgi:hypothetical protein